MGTTSVLGEAITETINYQSALDHEHAIHENDGHDGISSYQEPAG